jgi:hypothetical protein
MEDMIEGLLKIGTEEDKMPPGNYYYGETKESRNIRNLLMGSREGFRGCGIVSGRSTLAEEVVRKLRRNEEKREDTENVLDYQI